jgi:hypothetical protein
LCRSADRRSEPGDVSGVPDDRRRRRLADTEGIRERGAAARIRSRTALLTAKSVE